MSEATNKRAPRPPLVDGVLIPRPVVDAVRLTWWMQRGFLHGARRGHGASRALSAYLAAAWWVMTPVLIPAQSYLLTRRHARYYMSPSRDAVLGIVATSAGWHVEDHAAARPGTGRGRALRALVLPKLLAAADAAGVAIHTTAVDPRLAVSYSAELPGLDDVGRGYPRGRKLRRKPNNREPERDSSRVTSTPFQKPDLANWEIGIRLGVGAVYGGAFLVLLVYSFLPDADRSVVAAFMVAAGFGAVQALRKESSNAVFWVTVAQLGVAAFAAIALWVGASAQSIPWMNASNVALVALAVVATLALFLPPILGSQQLWAWEKAEFPTKRTDPDHSSRRWLSFPFLVLVALLTLVGSRKPPAGESG